MVDYLMVGEIRPEFPERELPVDDFGFAVALPLSDTGLSLMTREELAGLVEDAVLPEADCGASDSLRFDVP